MSVENGKTMHKEPPEGFLSGNACLIENRYLKQRSTTNCGGMSCIYKGWDMNLGIPVAIKVGDNPISKESIAREADYLATLSHHHIIRVLDIIPRGEYAGAMVMRYFDPNDNPTLENMLWSLDEPLKGIPAQKVSSFCTQIADALTYLHKQDIIHRDVKTENIIINSFGAMLFDLGIATKLSKERQNQVLGTPAYLSPEACVGMVTPSIDTWALAVAAFRTLTGNYPFGSDLIDPYEIMDRIALHSADFNLLRNDEFIDVFVKAFSKAPKDRYQSPLEFAEALDQATRSLSAL